uniref:LamG domain-containing protein n=1 Tax=viral metagenome TaxID=1070528 RepID=A0A6C0D1H4_9ZZZZ
MDTGTFSMIIIGLIIIVGGYLIMTDAVEGRSKMILIVVMGILTIAIIVNLGIFSSGVAALDSPVSAMSVIKPIMGGSYKYTANYSLTTWIYVSDWNTKPGTAKEIIKRKVRGVGEKVNNPRLSLDSYENQLNIDFCTYPKINGGIPVTNTINIPNIPTQKWVNITCCFSDKNIDTYINGKLVDTTIPPGALWYPSYKSNDTNLTSDLAINICPNKLGFSGLISNTKYYDNILTPEDAWNIYNKGYSSNMFGNLLNKYNASVTFYENQNQVGSPFYIM